MHLGITIAGLLCAAMLPPAAAVTIAGPPTFSAQATLDEFRGDLRPPGAWVAVQSRYRSAGATGAAAAVDPVLWFSGPPSVAEAEADDFNLRATARSQGTLFSNPTNTPRVSASARAETTRFFHFGSDWAVQDIPLLLDGVLGGHVGYAELPGQNFARIRYSLTLTDVAGQALGTVFQVSAQVTYVGNGAFVTSRAASGGADPMLWEAAFSPTTLPDTAFGQQQAWNVGYIDLIDSPFVALAGQTYGFRWTLESETLLEGQSVAGQFVADFGHTADIGLGLDAAQIAALGITEVLTAPVPEPPAALLLMLGLALGLRAQVRRRGRALAGAAALSASTLAGAQGLPGEAVLSVLRTEARVSWGSAAAPPATDTDPWRAEGQSAGLYALADVGTGTLRSLASVPAGGNDQRQASATTELTVQNIGTGSLTLGAGAVQAHLDASFLRGVGGGSQGTTRTGFAAYLTASAPSFGGSASVTYDVEEANRAGWPVESFRLGATPGFTATGSADPAALSVTLTLPGFSLLPGEALSLRLTMDAYASVFNPQRLPVWSAETDASRSAQLALQLPAGVRLLSDQPLAWVSVVPEPASPALWAAGAVLMALARHKRG